MDLGYLAARARVKQNMANGWMENFCFVKASYSMMFKTESRIIL